MRDIYAKDTRKLSDVRESVELNMVDLTSSAERRVKQRLSRTVTSEDFIELEADVNPMRLTERSPQKEEDKNDEDYAQARTLTRMSEMNQTAGR